MRQTSERPLFAALGAFAVALTTLAAGDAVAGDDASPAAAAATAAVPSSRIVSIGGAITEILYAVGKQQDVVAVDTTSLYPPSALHDKPNVGYMRQLSAEGVLAMAPTLILAIEGAGPQETIDVLARAKVPLVIVPDRFTGDSVIDKIETVAREAGAPERGACLAARTEQDLAALDQVRRQIREPVKVAFVLSLANGRPLIAGRATAADGIITMAGARNAFTEFEGYKPVNDEAIVAARPDALLAMQRGEHAFSAEAVFGEPGLAMTPAAQHKAFVVMDGLYLLGFGPRTVRAARDLAARLYPSLGASLPSDQGAGVPACDR